MSAPLLAVDAPFLLYRSFFALPESILGIDGRPIGALLGASSAILRIAAQRTPRAVVTCFGAEAAEYRVRLYPPYHANRPVPSPALNWQLEAAADLFAAFGWCPQSSATLEADDLLHSLALAESGAGGQTLLLTGDRDMYQCANENVTVLYLKQGTSGTEEIDPVEVKRRYGVPPQLVPDFIALRGDPSDSLPGAPGIGAKTAADLLRRHGSLEAVLAQAGAESSRIAGILRAAAPQLRTFLEIAKLQEVTIARPGDRETDVHGGARAARSHGMIKLAERLEKAQGLNRV